MEARHKIESQSSSKVASRIPLRKEKLKKEIKQFNPRFEEDFAQGKDYDVDRCHATPCAALQLFHGVWLDRMALLLQHLLLALAEQK